MTSIAERIAARVSRETAPDDAVPAPGPVSVPDDAGRADAGAEDGLVAEEVADADVVDAGVTPVGPESIDAFPVLAEARTLVPASSGFPAVQAAAVAATGFVAGAATLALMRRHAARRLARAHPARGRIVEMLPVVGSRTFIVDVHLLAKPGE